jgi:hypothetical protein
MHTHRISDVPLLAQRVLLQPRRPTSAETFPAGPGLKPVTAGPQGCQRGAMEISDGVNRYDKPIGRSAR